MKSTHLCAACAAPALLLALSSALLASAVLVQPHNYMLDDSPLTNSHDHSGSLSPFYNDAQASAEHQGDRDIVSILGDSLARLRFARMLDHQQGQAQSQQEAEAAGQLSQEMADLLQADQQQQAKEAADQQAGGSLSASVANMLMNVAQAAAGAAQADGQPAGQQEAAEGQAQMSPRGSILELDTTQAGGQSAAAQPNKADLKQSGPTQWYNPKETIPVLKISSMATPSKYKKVYFRSEKKLVDGAFHSPAGAEQSEKKPSLVKPFGAASMAGVQRRSSRGSASASPPGVLQDGVIDFLKKFRDVYVQTRPAGSSSQAGASSSPLSFSSVMSAAASSPLAAILAPSSSNSRPNFASALSTASQMVNSAAMLSQAAANSPAASSGAASSSSGASASAATSASAAGPNKSSLSAQSYVSFWSKTFPTWVRKVLKQMRRRSLYNSSKRQQHQHHSHSSAGVAQKIAHGAVAGVVESATSSTGNSAAASSNSSA